MIRVFNGDVSYEPNRDSSILVLVCRVFMILLTKTQI